MGQPAVGASRWGLEAAVLVSCPWPRRRAGPGDSLLGQGPPARSGVQGPCQSVWSARQGARTGAVIYRS